MRFDQAQTGTFFKKADFKDGMFFKILSPEPIVQESSQYKDKRGNPKKRYIWKLWYEGQEYAQEFNWTSIKNITEMYGGDSADWLGKWVMVKTFFDPAKKQTQIYFYPVEASQNTQLDEQFKGAVKEGMTPDQIQWEE